MPLGRAPALLPSTLLFPQLLPAWRLNTNGEKNAHVWEGVTGGMFSVLTFYFYTTSKHDVYDLREDGVGTDVFPCGREEGLEEIKNFERGTDLEAVAIVQRSKVRLTQAVTARMNCKNQI